MSTIWITKRSFVRLEKGKKYHSRLQSVTWKTDLVTNLWITRFTKSVICGRAGTTRYTCLWSRRALTILSSFPVWLRFLTRGAKHGNWNTNTSHCLYKASKFYLYGHIQYSDKGVQLKRKKRLLERLANRAECFFFPGKLLHSQCLITASPWRTNDQVYSLKCWCVLFRSEKGAWKSIS